ncbi:MAG: hypothetical protein ACK4GN_09115 [Runella sp.]
MFRAITTVSLCLLTTLVIGQNLKIILTKATFSYKSEGIERYMALFKVVSGKIESGQKAEFSILQNGQLKGYASLYAGSSLKTGETTKYEEEISVVSTIPLSAGMTLTSHDLAEVSLPPNRTFSFKTGQAFLGNQDYEYRASIQNLKGTLKVGDAIEYLNDRGQRSKAKITSLEVGGINPNILISGLPTDAAVSVGIISDAKFDFTNANVTQVGGLTSTATSTTQTAKTTSKDKIKKIPVNAILENNEVKITLHHLIKYNPDPANNQYDIFKVDYSLDYYIVDCTVENKSNRPIDSGEYMLRLNFFDKNGKSADEFLRVFKANSKSSDTQKDAEKVDLNVFGGTSKIRLSQVMAKYTENLPDYDIKHKASADAIMKELKPGQKIRSEIATLMGIPPTYKIEGIGTWGGTFFNKRNLIFVSLNF